MLLVPEAKAGVTPAAQPQPHGALIVLTVAEAERVAGDLVPMIGEDGVELFPAWETLPFERVSPALETMGRRLRVMWRLRTGGDAARMN